VQRYAGTQKFNEIGVVPRYGATEPAKKRRASRARRNTVKERSNQRRRVQVQVGTFRRGETQQIHIQTEAG
jgi:hypothetical protein